MNKHYQQLSLDDFDLYQLTLYSTGDSTVQGILVNSPTLATIISFTFTSGGTAGIK